MAFGEKCVIPNYFSRTVLLGKIVCLVLWCLQFNVNSFQGKTLAIRLIL